MTNRYTPLNYATRSLPEEQLQEFINLSVQASDCHQHLNARVDLSTMQISTKTEGHAKFLAKTIFTFGIYAVRRHRNEFNAAYLLANNSVEDETRDVSKITLTCPTSARHPTDKNKTTIDAFRQAIRDASRSGSRSITLREVFQRAAYNTPEAEELTPNKASTETARRELLLDSIESAPADSLGRNIWETEELTPTNNVTPDTALGELLFDWIARAPTSSERSIRTSVAFNTIREFSLSGKENTLSLTHLGLTEIPPGLNLLPSLTTLDLTGNHIKDLGSYNEANTFGPQVTTVNLSINDLDKQPESLDTIFPGIRYLDVSSNKIKNAHLRAWPTNLAIKTLNNPHRDLKK